MGTALIAVAMVFVGANRSDKYFPVTASAHDVTLLYVGAADCAPCRSWQRGAGAAFRASPEFARVSYREVKSSTVLDLLDDQYWPEDLRNYRGQLAPGAGVPLWFVVSDHEIVEQAFGESQWANAVLPKIKSLLQ